MKNIMGPNGGPAIELLKALGLEGKGVRKLTLTMATNEAVTVTVEMLQREPESGAFTEALKEYVLVPKESLTNNPIPQPSSQRPNQLPPLPKPPLSRHLMDGIGTICKDCGSSTVLNRWWKLFGVRRCIHPECGLEQ